MILLSALHEQQHPCFDMWIFTRVFVFIFSHTCTLSPLDYLQLCCLMSTCLDSSVFFLLLIFSLSPLWPENSFYMILIYLNVLKFVLWPRIWFILTKCLMDTLNMCVYWFSPVLSHFLMASTLSNENFAVIRVETFMVVSHFSLVITEIFFYLSLVSGHLLLCVFVWMSLNLIFGKLAYPVLGKYCWRLFVKSVRWKQATCNFRAGQYINRSSLLESHCK